MIRKRKLCSIATSPYSIWAVYMVYMRLEADTKSLDLALILPGPERPGLFGKLLGVDVDLGALSGVTPPGSWGAHVPI